MSQKRKATAKCTQKPEFNKVPRQKAKAAAELRDDGVPEEELELPEAIEIVPPSSDDGINFSQVYGKTQDEDWEDAGPERDTISLRPSLEFFMADGKLCFVVKGDTARMYKESREGALSRLEKLRLIGKGLTEKYKSFLCGRVSKLQPILTQKDFASKYAGGGISATVLSNLLSRRSVELPEGRIIPLRSFFSDAHGITEIPAEDKTIRVAFAEQYLAGKPLAKPTAIARAYIKANRHIEESKNPDGQNKDYQGSLRKWFENHLKKLKRAVTDSSKG